MSAGDTNPKMAFHELRVAEVIEETHDTKSFVFDIPESLRDLFAYRAGQFFTFEVPWGGMQLKRSYSLASSPDTDDKPKVAVKRVDDGRVSNWFNDNVSAGDVIRTQAPAGRFVLKEDHNAELLTLFGGGSGITPMMSLVKTALTQTDRRVKLIYANRDIRSIIFKDELIELQARFPHRLTVLHHLDTVSGFLAAEDVRAHVAEETTGDFYICGPGPFMDTVEETLTGLGVDRQHLNIERFVSPVDPDRREGAPEAEAAADAGDGTSAAVTLILDGTSHEFEVASGETILAAAMRNGVEAEYQCEEGYCGCCMAKLSSGEVSMALHDALTEGEIEDGWVLTCQARCKTSAVEVNYDETF